MPGFNPASISSALNYPLSEQVHRMFNYGIDGSIISGKMWHNALPNVYAESVTQLADIGSKLRMKDSREFIYCKAAAAEIGIAKMAQAEAVTDQWTDETQTAYGWTAGDTSNTCLITTGSTPTADEWKDGWMIQTNGTGLGQMHRIVSNTSHATLPVVTVAEAVVTDIPAAGQLSFVKSNFLDTIVVDKTAGLTALAIGVPLITVTASYFYWSQVKGPAPLTVDTGETVSVGFPVTHPATCAVDGTCGPCVTLENRYGDVMYVAAADKIAVVNLDLGI